MSTPTHPLPNHQPGLAAPELRIEAADATALPMIYDWAAANSWSPGEHDFRCYLEADPQSLYVGYLGVEPVSAVFVGNHDADFAHLGAYMVPPQHRGRGYGRATFDAAMNHAGSRVVGLHAVTDQVENYKRSGFGPTYSTWRYSGVLPAPRPSTPSNIKIVDAGQVGLAALTEYDARHFRASRPAFLQAWTSAPGHLAKVALDHDVAIVGFGVIRPTVDHARIGPLYARDTGTARTLLHALTDAINATTVAMDAPETNRAIEPLAAGLRLAPDFQMVTMFTAGPIKPVHHPGVFAVASAELG
ncbi:GNAT superfamily N-acetyltransferase [Catenulispora sp. GAS73]|uniref:GNAT family N-acetyltransferase n=1 Tax=Catenulispora sp. GAS73 TaxID=3156269 RepID=UPI0035131F09